MEENLTDKNIYNLILNGMLSCDRNSFLSYICNKNVLKTMLMMIWKQNKIGQWW